ncbi:MAG: ROK family protein [Nanoarchaeota archaeon]
MRREHENSPLAAMPMTKIGVDVGGTKIIAGRVSNGKILRECQVATESPKGKAVVLKNICAAIEEVMDSSVKGIGVGHPGPLNPVTGVIGKEIVNVPTGGVNLKRFLEKKFTLPVIVDNDAKCFTLAQTLYGKGKSKRAVLGITLGTGVGSGLCIDGKLYHGRGNAMEIGHMSIDHDGRPGRCGNRGCFEKYAATIGLLHSAAEHGLKVSGGKELAELALAGNQTAKKLYAELGYYLGVGLANAADAYDPDIIIIGGNLRHNWELFMPVAIKEMKARSLVAPCPVVKTNLTHSAVIGAASLDRSKFL